MQCLTRNYDRLALQPIHFIVTCVCVCVCVYVQYYIEFQSFRLTCDQIEMLRYVTKMIAITRIVVTNEIDIRLISLNSFHACYVHCYECTSHILGNLHVEHSTIYTDIKWQIEVEKSPSYL